MLSYVAGRFARGRDYAETDVNRILQAVHGDHAMLRRYLVDAVGGAGDRPCDERRV